MAYKLKQANYLKKPSSEMRKLWTQAWSKPLTEIPHTRIDFNLAVKEILAGPEGAARKDQLKSWRITREQGRAERKRRRLAAQAAAQSNGGGPNA